ncbi:MAG: hypothetical protein Roseis2KO_17230 [Roseivirga sp.]
MKKFLDSLSQYDVVKSMLLLFFFSLIGATCLYFPASIKDSNSGNLVYGVGLFLIGSSTLVGGIIGFLFGVPRTTARMNDYEGRAKPVNHKGKETDDLYRPNNSLEQITDWLTKIIVGAGLIEIRQISRLIGEIGDDLGPTFASGPAGKAIVVGIIVHYVLMGFIEGYLMSYLWLPGAFRRANRKEDSHALVRENYPKVLE